MAQPLVIAPLTVEEEGGFILLNELSCFWVNICQT
jgi:hypothetical protein